MSNSAVKRSRVVSKNKLRKKKKFILFFFCFCYIAWMRVCMRRVLQFRANSMTQKAFIVRKERKQSHCRRRRKPAFPNCESIDEALSDNALDVYFCLVSLLHRCTSAQRSRFRIIFFFTNVHP